MNVKNGKRMEELRKKLNILACDIENCDREKLLEISQEMDKVINEYIKEKDKRMRVFSKDNCH